MKQDELHPGVLEIVDVKTNVAPPRTFTLGEIENDYRSRIGSIVSDTTELENGVRLRKKVVQPYRYKEIST